MFTAGGVGIWVWLARPALPVLADWTFKAMVPVALSLSIVLAQQGKHAVSRSTAFAMLAIWFGGMIAQQWRVPRPVAATAVTVDRGRVVTVPHGTVELAGIALDWYASMSPVWWHADGGHVRVRDWSIDQDYVPELVDHYRQRMFVVRARGDGPAARVLGFRIEGSEAPVRTLAVTSEDARAGEWLGVSTMFPHGQQSTSLSVQVATGPFTVAAPLADSSNGGRVSIEGAEVTWRPIVDDQGRGAVTVTWQDPAGVRTSIEYRLQARGADSEWKIAATGDGERHIFEGMKASDVNEVRFEWRRAHWCTFRDVPLFDTE